MEKPYSLADGAGSSCRSDEEAMQDFKRTNDAQSFAILYSKYFHSVWLYERRYRSVIPWAQAEELTEEAFLKIIAHRNQYDERKCFRPWLFAIATHVKIDFIRRQNRRVIEVTSSDNDEGSDFLAFGDTLSSVPSPEFIAAIHESLMKLRPELREVMELCLFWEFSNAEIAIILNLPIGTVCSRIHNAKRKIRLLLGVREQ